MYWGLGGIPQKSDGTFEQMDGSLRIDNRTVQYCLSQLRRERCKVRASMPIMILIIFMNAVKAACIAFTIFDGTTTLVTLGDTICSFLKVPDPYTKGYCTLTKYGVAHGRWSGRPNPRYWLPVRIRRREANSWHQWLLSNIR